MKNIEFIHQTEYSEGILKEILKLDEKAYPEEYRGTFESVSARYKKAPNMFILARDKEKVVGYICFFPISKRISSLAESYSPEQTIDYNNEDLLLDDNITGSDIVSLSQDVANDLLLISVVVDKKYHGMGIASNLANKLKKYLIKMKIAGYKVGKVWTYAISPGGNAIVKNAGFKLKSNVTEVIDGVNHENKLYSLNVKNNYDLQVFFPCNLKKTMYKKSKKDEVQSIIEAGRTKVIDKWAKLKTNDKINEYYVENVLENTGYEVSSNLLQDNSATDRGDLKRTFLGQYKLVTTDDSKHHDNEINNSTLKINLYITFSKKTLLGSLVLHTYDYLGDVTELQDYISSEKHKIVSLDNNDSDYVNMFLEKNFGINILGKPMYLISTMLKDDERTIKYILAQESANSQEVDFELTSKRYVDLAKRPSNIAAYDFYDIYAAEGTIYNLLKTNDGQYLDIKERTEMEAWWAFILDVVTLKISSIRRTTYKMTNILDNKNHFNSSHYKDIMSEYVGSIRFRQDKLFQYTVTQKLYDDVNELFKIPELEASLDKDIRDTRYLVQAEEVVQGKKMAMFAKVIGVLLSIATSITTIKAFVSGISPIVLMATLIPIGTILAIILPMAFIFWKHKKNKGNV